MKYSHISRAERERRPTPDRLFGRRNCCFRFRRLLLLLDRLPLRRAFLALQEVSWNSVWKMTGHVMEQRYKLISEQFESLRHLQTENPSVSQRASARSAWLRPGGNQSDYYVLRLVLGR